TRRGNYALCNEDDRKKAMQIPSLNEEIVFSDLLCNPLRNTNFFNTMKSMRKEKLWDCFELESVKAVLDECVTKRTKPTKNTDTFQDSLDIVTCVTPGLR
ncbi:unnamed protein product, partial [Allacma fusca]